MSSYALLAASAAVAVTGVSAKGGQGWLGQAVPPCVALIGFMVPQGQRYRSFELAKNRDPETESSLAFLSAFAVHPVSEGTLMYRLHKRFSALELERAYSEIEQLQVSRGPRVAGQRVLQMSRLT